MPMFTKNIYEADMAKYYDVMHKYRNYGMECQFADKLIQRCFPNAKRVLDICCGTGEHAIKMAQLGYEVTGVDSSRDMIQLAIKKAKKVGVSVEFKCTDVHDLNIVPEFQAAYCLGYTFNYMTTYPDVVKFFDIIRKALAPNGVLLVDFINGWGLIESIPRDKFVHQHEDATIFHFEQASLDKKKRVRHIEFYYLIDRHDGRVKTVFTEEDLRIFFEDEVQMLLSNCGFKHVESFGNYTLDTTASDVSDIVIVTGRKESKNLE